MHWTDTAIILSARKQGETSALLRVMTREHGMHAGIFKGAFSKSRRGVAMPGNLVEVQWTARLSEHLGNFQCELLEPVAALLMQEPHKLSALTAACAMLEATLPERDPHPEIFQLLVQFIHHLDQRGHRFETCVADYVMLELELLRLLGFGLDLSTCAATESEEDLIYVSPKSGRAVSRAAGEPYRDKLHALPEFMKENAKNIENLPPAAQELIDGLRVTGYFLESRVFAPRNHRIPIARERFIGFLNRNAA